MFTASSVMDAVRLSPFELVKLPYVLLLVEGNDRNFLMRNLTTKCRNVKQQLIETPNYHELRTSSSATCYTWASADGKAEAKYAAGHMRGNSLRFRKVFLCVLRNSGGVSVIWSLPICERRGSGIGAVLNSCTTSVRWHP